MVGKMRVVVFLTLLVMSMAGAVQADTVIPLVVGYNATYISTWEGSTTTNPYTATLQITGTETLADTNTWWITKFYNWDGDGNTTTTDMRATATALYFGGSASPHVVIGDVGTQWVDEDGRNCKIISITATYAGYNNVYEMLQSYDEDTDHQSTSYWKPGVGFLGEITPNYLGSSHPRTMVLTSYATPLPPSLVLFGFGLVGLLGFRRLRRS